MLLSDLRAPCTAMDEAYHGPHSSDARAGHVKVKLKEWILCAGCVRHVGEYLDIVGGLHQVGERLRNVHTGCILYNILRER